MRFFLDTEFNGHGGELISLALVSEWTLIANQPHKKEFHWYGARRIKGKAVPWVKQNIYPVINAHFLSDGMFRNDFQNFVGRWPGMEVICDWHDDARHFCSLLSGETYETSLYLPCTIRILVTPEGQPRSELPHNALADARALRDWYETVDRAA